MQNSAPQVYEDYVSIFGRDGEVAILTSDPCRPAWMACSLAPAMCKCDL